MMDKKEAMARLDAIEAEAKKLREIIEAPEKVEPWRPKKLTLCWVWDGDEGPEEPVCARIDRIQGGMYSTANNMRWDHAQPLTRAEALAMVDEPSRYPWDKAPEWANWAATDADGDVYWYEEEPCLGSSDNWSLASVSRYLRHSSGPRCADWRESWEPRP